MTFFFFREEANAPSANNYALYVVLFVSYLGVALFDFMRQAVRHSQLTGRRSVRAGLRLAALGCILGMVYAAYKMTVVTSLLFGLRLVSREGPGCTSLVAAPCVFSVTAPACAVLLVGVGVTLPAVLYPIQQFKRRRWEIRSLVSLEPLWRDLADALPHIVLRADGDDDDMNLDPGFRLHRRVIEISDGLLELRPYRSKTVLETARRRVDAHTTLGAGFVEAALTRAALAALRSGRKPCDAVVAELTPRGGDLRAEADWLVTVAHAYAGGAAPDAAPADERPDTVGV